MTRLHTTQFDNMPWNKEGEAKEMSAAALDNGTDVQAITDGPRDAAQAELALPGAPTQPALGDVGAKALEDKGDEYAIAVPGSLSN